MYEHVSTPAIWMDEAVPFLGVEPPDRAVWQRVLRGGKQQQLIVDDQVCASALCSAARVTDASSSSLR